MKNSHIPIKYEVLQNIYIKMKETLCPLLTLDEMSKLTKAWKIDISKGDSIAGPMFDVAISDLREGNKVYSTIKELYNEWYYAPVCDSAVDSKVELTKAWFIAAAIRDWLIEKKYMPEKVS